MGDSRAILCDVDGNVIRQLTVDHTPSNASERGRVLSEGGKVESGGGILRVDGKLAVSRSFGDVDIAGVSAVPYVTSFKAEEECGEKHCFAIVATDGLWDVVNNEDAGRIAADIIKKENGAQEAAEILTEEAWVRGSKEMLPCLWSSNKEIIKNKHEQNLLMKPHFFFFHDASTLFYKVKRLGRRSLTACGIYNFLSTPPSLIPFDMNSNWTYINRCSRERTPPKHPTTSLPWASPQLRPSAT